MTIKWMEHAAFNGRQNQNFQFLRYVLLYFDIRVRLKISKIRATGKANNNFQKIGFIHIPKTGGTYLSSLKEQLPFISFNHVLSRDDRSDRFCPVGLTAIKSNKIRDYYLFSVVRNPFGFFRSYYHHVLGSRIHYNYNHYDYHNAQRGFDYLVNTIIHREDTWPSRKFLYPQLFDEAGIPLINFVLRQEQLDQDLDILFQKFGRQYSPKTKQRVSVKCVLDDYYSPTIKNLISDIYYRELSLFGYDGFEVVQPRIDLKDFGNQCTKYNYLSDSLYLDGFRLNQK